jgi:hypothetical protein
LWRAGRPHKRSGDLQQESDIRRLRGKLNGRSRSQRVRATLNDGRIVEGYRTPGPLPTEDGFLELSQVIRVCDLEDKELVSTPMDHFIPASKITEVDEGVAAGRRRNRPS